MRFDASFFLPVRLVSFCVCCRSERSSRRTSRGTGLHIIYTGVPPHFFRLYSLPDSLTRLPVHEVASENKELPPDLDDRNPIFFNDPSEVPHRKAGHISG